MRERSAECARVREQLLVADIVDLRGDGRSDVAAHVRTCAECAAVATCIIDGYRRIDAALNLLSTRQQQGRWQRRNRKRLAGGFALAAAAAVALLLLPIRREAGPSVRIDSMAPLSTALVVNAAGPGAVAVMRTSDPMITVIWYLQDVRWE